MTMARRDERLEKQRIYQREYREKRRVERAPDRDDIARAMLRYMIVTALRRGNDRLLSRVIAEVSRQLIDQGFKAEATRAAWDGLLERYEDGWDFFPKPHLRRHEVDATGDGSGD
ncbi:MULTISPECIES: hypothetical protein [Phyllobacteriaceae]|jgi:hypothetical protein|nr:MULTISPECIES: hypothetical protein [Mesorhizobium]MBN9236348.1 hypothetical protein [Mesorhizobium sp.]MDQ0327750.1 hypothetical protein [Mesorhizobium sp. YL-MeA3-2017]